MSQKNKDNKASIKKQEPIVIPSDPRMQQTHKNMHGPGEVLDLLSGNLKTNEQINKALDIMHTREKSSENKETKQYRVYMTNLIFKWVVSIIIILVLSGIFIYLIRINQNELAKLFMSHIVALIGGGFGGFGIAKIRN